MIKDLTEETLSTVSDFRHLRKDSKRHARDGKPGVPCVGASPEHLCFPFSFHVRCSEHLILVTCGFVEVTCAFLKDLAVGLMLCLHSSAILNIF